MTRTEHNRKIDELNRQLSQTQAELEKLKAVKIEDDLPNLFQFISHAGYQRHQVDKHADAFVTQVYQNSKGIRLAGNDKDGTGKKATAFASSSFLNIRGGGKLKNLGFYLGTSNDFDSGRWTIVEDDQGINVLVPEITAKEYKKNPSLFPLEG